jgi:hypothetical protein
LFHKVCYLWNFQFSPNFFNPVTQPKKAYPHEATKYLLTSTPFISSLYSPRFSVAR